MRRDLRPELPTPASFDREGLSAEGVLDRSGRGPSNRREWLPRPPYGREVGPLRSWLRDGVVPTDDRSEPGSSRLSRTRGNTS